MSLQIHEEEGVMDHCRSQRLIDGLLRTFPKSPHAVRTCASSKVIGRFISCQEMQEMDSKRGQKQKDKSTTYKYK